MNGDSSQLSTLGKWWKQVGDRFRCDLCPRHCMLHPGQRGFCFVRQAHTDGIHLTTYGQTSGFCIDPIEKKPLYHFYPHSEVLSFGTIGCNLACHFCQNWDISKAKSNERLLEFASPVQIAQAAQFHDCLSVAFTYNDPVIFAEYAIDTAKECQRLGIQTVAVTAGYISEIACEEFYKHMNAVNMDFKFFSKEYYAKYSGVHFEHILEQLKYLSQRKETWLELTTLLIPGLHDSEEELRNMCHWLVKNVGPNVPLHFSAFHPDYKMREFPHTPFSTLQKARMIAHQEGMNYVYTGNVHDPEGSSTYCKKCKTLLIGRSGFRITQWSLENGRCKNCSTVLEGHFSEGTLDLNNLTPSRRVRIHSQTDGTIR